MTRTNPVPTSVWIGLLAVAGVMVVVPPVLALSGVGRDQSASTGSPSQEPRTTPDRRVMRAEDFGSAWPLSVPTAVVHCERVAIGGRQLQAVTAEVGGGTYAINGTALSQRRYSELPRSLWRDDPAAPGLDLKVSIEPVITRGFEICAAGGG